MNALHRSIIACLVFIFLIFGTIPSIWASVSFTGYLPLSGDPVNPIYDFEKSFYIHYPQGSKLQSILQNKNVTISFTEDANNNTDVKTLMDEINNYISTKGHSAATMSNLVVDYKLLVTGYADHASFDYTLVLTPTVTNYMLNKPTDGIPETLDASWMAFSITSPVAIYTKQYGPIEINSPLSVIQSQLPDVYNEIKGTDASQIFTYAMLDTTKLFDQQPLNKWDSLFDPAYTLTETAGYGFKEQ
ncbi:MAG: hypothetical protein KGL95_02925, partial [Patescibacteria group bacterium]|nr:hypothetical protein [Patescibacteria group bacterium]